MGGRLTSARRSFRARLLSVLLAVLSNSLGRLGWRGGQRWGAALGGLGWKVARRDRKRTLAHLELAFPDLGDGERRQLGRACFRHLGAMLGECLVLRHGDCALIESLVEVEGWENVERLRSAQRGILILTGHCGNWELLAALINCRSLGMAVVARAIDESSLNDALVAFRRRFGTITIERGEAGAARKLLRIVRPRQGPPGALGMLIDQDTKVEGAWVDFFARPAFTPLGAASLALRFDLAVVPTFIERRDDGTHLARFSPPLALPPDPVDATARMTEAIEQQIRCCPQQWVWMHRRWRHRPPEPA